MRYEGQLTHTNGPRAWHYVGATAVDVKRSADLQMRKLGATLNREVDFHPDSFVYTDGAEAVGLLVIVKSDEPAPAKPTRARRKSPSTKGLQGLLP